jgi:hypothetical protein
MEIGTRADSDKVLVMMNVDQAIEPALRARVDAAVGACEGWFIEL